MVQQMLFATRIQAGGVQLNREILDLVSLVKRTLQRLHPVAESAGAKLTIDGPDLLDQPPIWVYADSEKILQVITNLVENAIKYGGKGLVSVSASAQAPWAVVSVTDQGPGIAPDEHAKIFTPFERGQETLKSRVRGAGLGLYICKAIIEAHDGRIHVDSHLGQGARFSFRIPLEMEQS
jgi:signal transduction histidine kinase